MRPRILAPLVLLLLVAATAGTALAAGEKGAEHRARHEELRDARHAALDSFHENRTRILEEYRATLHAIKDSYLENKTKLLDDCHAARDAAAGYAYGEGDKAEPKCIHDGMKLLHASARENMTQAREKAHADLKEARSDALKSFANARAAAHAKYGKP